MRYFVARGLGGLFRLGTSTISSFTEGVGRLLPTFSQFLFSAYNDRVRVIVVIYSQYAHASPHAHLAIWFSERTNGNLDFTRLVCTSNVREFSSLANHMLSW